MAEDPVSCAGEDKVAVEVGTMGSSTAVCGGKNYGARELAAGGGEGGQRRAAEQSASAAPEEEEKGDFPRDLFAILKKHRDPTVN
jgi:hypothetical protein